MIVKVQNIGYSISLANSTMRIIVLSYCDSYKYILQLNKKAHLDASPQASLLKYCVCDSMIVQSDNSVIVIVQCKL